MIRRTGFVGNSSSSSYLVVGVSIENSIFDERNELIDLADKYSFSLHDIGYSTIIGVSFSAGDYTLEEVGPLSSLESASKRVTLFLGEANLLEYPILVYAGSIHD